MVAAGRWPPGAAPDRGQPTWCGLLPRSKFSLVGTGRLWMGTSPRAFNAASLASMLSDRRLAFTVTDPVPASILLLVVRALLGWTESFLVVHGLVAVVFLSSLVHKGILLHLSAAPVYSGHPEAYHAWAWMLAPLLNSFGGGLILRKILAVDQRLDWSSERWSVFRIGALAWLLFFSWSLTGAAEPALCTDTPFFTAPASSAPMEGVSLPVERRSTYLTMSDGVRLAVDVYLPVWWAREEAHRQEGLPTFFHLTRYHRNEKRSWIGRYVSLFGDRPGDTFNMRSLHYISRFVPDGYAFVTVDVRGTGASFGSRPVDLSPREQEDYLEVLDWVLQQPFCNGRVGTGGISYDGITGALVSAAARGRIQAAALLFTPADIFKDIGLPGGVPCTGFVDLYAKFTTASERNEPVNDVDNELPSSFKLVSAWLFDGVAPVHGETSEPTSTPGCPAHGVLALKFCGRG